MAAALPQLIDRFPDLEDELPWHLTASAWGEDDREPARRRTQRSRAV